MSRNIVRVLPDGSLWKVTYNSSFRKSFDLKTDAIEYGKSVAKLNQPSQLVIHKSDWTIETEYTYGDDPYPPKG